MTDKEKVKKSRDPIFMVCLVVFLLAGCAVISAGVYDKYLAPDNTQVNDGDTVTVNYTLTLYAAYGEENAAVLDTTYESIGTDDSILKANDFSKTSYSTFEVEMGGDDVLIAFQNALLGHKVGETVKIEVGVGDGYVCADTSKVVDCTQSQTVSATETMTVTEFESIYEDLNGEAVNNNFTSKYGWLASSSYNQSTGMVVITYSPEAGKSYVNYDGDFGKVTLDVSAVTASTITFTYDVEYQSTGSTVGNIEVQMIKVDFGTSYFYITSVTDPSSDGVADTFTCRTCGEKYNEVLYFEITIVSIE
jgi:FKBP-type peptidyl-prolyl cis-trans isomerase 2